MVPCSSVRLSQSSSLHYKICALIDPQRCFSQRFLKLHPPFYYWDNVRCNSNLRTQTRRTRATPRIEENGPVLSILLSLTQIFTWHRSLTTHRIKCLEQNLRHLPCVSLNSFTRLANMILNKTELRAAFSRSNIF